MSDKRIQFNTIINNQLPPYIKEEFPLVADFLSQYYIAQEFKGSSIDLIQNIDQYIKLDESTSLVESSVLYSDIDLDDTTITIDISKTPGGTKSFPNSYGLIQIDNEIITYTGKTVDSFTGCIRGFSGVTSIDAEVEFSSTEADSHAAGTTITNLSDLFLKKFLLKTKIQLIPGIENRELDSKVNQNILIKQFKDFYSSKGTDESFQILFGALYNEKVKIVRPREHLLRPSDARYRVTNDFVVESVYGNPYDLTNLTLFQKEYNGINPAYGPVASVEKISTYDNSDYYQLKIDGGYDRDITYNGAIYGDFSAHAKTKVIGSVSAGTTTIDVDSTIGFPNSGELYVNYSNSTGIVSYTSKTNNQFIDCTNVTDSIADTSYIGINTYASATTGFGTEISVRITSVIDSLTLDPDSYFYTKGDNVNIKTLGEENNSIKFKNWLLNVAPSYKVKSLSAISTANKIYALEFDKDHIFYSFDNIKITDENNTIVSGYISEVRSSKKVVVILDTQITVSDSKIYTAKRILSKPNFSNFKGANIFNANVHNTYAQGDTVLISADSLPFFDNSPLNVGSGSISITGTFVGDTFQITSLTDHGFYTGDEVYYAPEKVVVNDTIVDGTSLGIEEGLYFVKRIDSNNIKLSRSRSDIDNSRFITLDTSMVITNNTLCPYKLYGKDLKSQKLLREIRTTEITGKEYKTNPGKIGILVDGVEILNYKSSDLLYYGQVNELLVTSPGNNYDIINVPELTVNDRSGIGVTAHPSILGDLKRIDIIDGGFDYLEDPKIDITGGNGVGAQAKVHTKLQTHINEFNSQIASNLVSIGASLSTIGFSTYHKFRNGEQVIYQTNAQTAVGGLSTGAKYNVGVEDPNTVKLYNTFANAISGINTVVLSTYGIGNHNLESVNKKKVIDSVSIVSPGVGYENKKRTCFPVGIVTSKNYINIDNHNYQSGELLKYYNNETGISGISTNTEYYVTAVDENNFQLSEVGASDDREFFYRTNQYINLESQGDGLHSFNYPEISVKVLGNFGVYSTSLTEFEEFKAKIRPVFRGSIQSVHLSSKGSGYGSEQTLNSHRKPNVTINQGTGAILNPIVSNGKIVEVLINNVGSGYYSVPDLVLTGTGTGASFTPIIEDGKIISVKVISKGSGYTPSTTTLLVTTPGSGFIVDPQIQTWNVNNVQKYRDRISADDGFIVESSNPNFDLQYTHLYAPRKLREKIYSINQVGEYLYFAKDLVKSGNVESLSSNHSPIIGWAYDGNPIYGPYAYENATGGSVTLMKSGYSINLKANRPSTSYFPEGFFIEDYEYLNYADDSVLDKNNGRFGITPDYPNGVYAYFSTINPLSADSGGSFSNYRSPVFPYLIGDAFKSKPNPFNFKSSSNQNEFDLNETDYMRNVEYYNIGDGQFYYDYIDLPNNLDQTFTIKSTYSGNIDDVVVNSGGDGYKVNDTLVFDNEDINGNIIGNGAYAKVSKICGKNVDSISVATTSFYGVEFYPGNGKSDYVAYFDSPHNLRNTDRINVSSLSIASSKIGGSYVAGISSNALFLVGLGSSIVGLDVVANTGIVTSINVAGNLTFNAIRENDIIQISDEKLKVLNVNQNASILRVLREIDGTVGVAHTIGETIYENPRKLTINVGFRSDYRYNVNRQLYFNPVESVGLGTISGLGIGVTLSIPNPGVGITEIFVPTKTLYLPSHGFITGQALTYSPNGGDVLEVSPDGISTSVTLSDQSILYVAKVSDDLIGLSTVTVGLGTTGNFVGISTTTSTIGTLFFTGIGTGLNHSFNTRYTPITGQISKNTVTVSTSQTHGLANNDFVNINASPGLTTTHSIKYNDYNRILITNTRSFSGVNTTSNTINIDDHGYKTGQKILHTATTPAGGLVNEKTYYVVVFDDDNIRLSTTLFDAQSQSAKVVNLTSTSSGNISLVNPQIIAYKDSTLNFDLSDSSLSYQFSFNNYPAFDFNLYSDSKFTDLFETTRITNNFEVQKTGTIGVSTDAQISIKVSGDLPEKLFYKLSPVFDNNIPVVKQEVIVDDTFVGFGEIQINNSKYNGNKQIIVDTDKSFTYTLNESPENSSYSAGISSLTYDTDSLFANGPIFDIKLTNKGFGYSDLPNITTINSSIGKNAIVEVKGNTIGRPRSVKVNNVGFNFPSDHTLRPSTILPQIIRVDPLSSFKSIAVSFFGKGYEVAPKLLVFDGKTNEIIPEVDIRYVPRNNVVSIFKNTYGISNVTPKILPIENPNGVPISNIEYNKTTDQVTVTLAVGFSTADSFPIKVNDKVMIENISTGIGTTANGYNSEGYDYSLFTIVAVHENLGGLGATVAYNMGDLLSGSNFPGTFDSANSSGRIIPEKDFPTFDIELIANNFIKGEEVFSNTVLNGVVDDWDPKNQYLKVLSKDTFVTDEKIYGVTSKSQALASNVTQFSSFANLNPSARIENGWQESAGFLNSDIERLQDGLYYQNFSYSLKSKIDYDSWDDVVSTMNHTAGFKKFSDLQLESDSETRMSVGVSTSLTNIEIINHLTGVVDLNCVYDFDLVRENSLIISSRLVSDEIIFENRILNDYLESKGNRVLDIDDFSGTFNSNPRPTPYSEVYRFDKSQVRAQKLFTYVSDKRYYDERQLMIVTIVNDKNQGYLNQYGRVKSTYDIGSFDLVMSGSDGIVNFYPNKFRINDFNISVLAYNVYDSILSVGSTAIGESLVSTSSTVVSTGTTTNIVSLGSTYTTNKVLVEITKDDGEYQFDEINIISNGTDVEMVDYGQLTTDPSIYSISGFGTYYSYIDGSNIKLDFIPAVGVACTINSMQVSIANTETSGIGTITMDRVILETKTTSISASGSPSATVVGSYSDTYDTAYFIVQVADETNIEYQMCEILVIDDDTNAYITEFGNVETSSSLGTFDANRNGTDVELTFTPNPSIDVQVKVYMNAQYHADSDNDVIDFTNGTIESAEGTYTGTESDIKRKFALKHKTYPIFEKYFDGSSSLVNLTTNSVTLNNHYFVTGEKLNYHYAGAGSTQAIQIASTTVPGIGVTDKLPSELYAVKINENTLEFASTAENALKATPVTFDITSVGIGTNHRFVANNQNAKVIVTIDNVIQSPIVGASLTTTLVSGASQLDDLLTFSGITSFFSGDLIKINDEVMKVEGIGIGATNIIRVRRPWMGTEVGVHSSGSTVIKIEGNYNIVGNEINFATAPFGNIPIGSITNPPDERDWTGITTSSSFHGRSFMRSGVPNSSDETYYRNYIFDDISDQFTGSRRDFTLKESGSNIVGIKTENAIILINEIFQDPGVSNDYSLEEISGITTVSFTGTATSAPHDANSTNLPLGGVIVSVSSTEGFGYQPLVSAGGTAEVSTAGTITSISIGYSGSGYRSGIGQTVNVSIQQESLDGTDIVAIGTATIGATGSLTGVAVTNSQVFYSPKTITNVGYNSITGMSTVTTSTAHGLSVGNEVLLSGIAFTCTYSGSKSIVGFAYSAASGIVTVTTSGAHGYSVNQDVIFTGIGMTCALGPSTTHTYPRTTDPYYTGSRITSIGSSTEFVTNVGVSTVPTFYTSGGTVQGAIIAPRVSDPAAGQATVDVVIDDNTFSVNTGISTRQHFYSRGGKVNKPLKVLFDDPLSYSNIPLIYSSSSVGIGTESKIDIVVGQGSSVIDFEIKNTGYSYGIGDILTVPFGGTTGIPTSAGFNEFQITIKRTFNDKFSGWSIGELQVLDSIEDLFDGETVTFTLKSNQQLVSINSRSGSNVNIEDTLLVFVNNILQIPNEGYVFNGGSLITFTEAPKVDDLCKILFYKGTGSVDVIPTDILETVKVGDNLKIGYDSFIGQPATFQEEARTVTEINSTDFVTTNPYYGPGNTSNETLTRPVVWCRQTEDKIIDGKEIGKDRIHYEPRINPFAYLVQSVGIGTTIVSVDNIRPFFNPINENNISLDFQNNVTFISQETQVSASATAVVSGLGTISSIVISDGGIGYSNAPIVIIQNPVGLGTTTRASATASITAGIVTSITMTGPGTGYTSVPLVLIETPTFTKESNSVTTYEGDSGIIVGVTTTSVGVATGIILDLYIPEDSFFRDTTVVGLTTISGIQTGYYLSVYNSNVGDSVTSLDSTGAQVGVGTTCLDNIYEVISVSIGQTNAPGIGLTYVAKATVSVSDYNGLSGIGNSNYYGNYSWGRITLPSRSKSKEYNAYLNSGSVGITTGTIVQRTNTLKYLNYT